jgi:hypothetical protein
MDAEHVDHWRGNGQPTMGEIHRALEALDRRFDRLAEDTLGRFDKLAIAYQEASLGHVQQAERIRVLERDVAAQQASQTWAWRTVALSTFTGITGLAIAILTWLLNR